MVSSLLMGLTIAVFVVELIKARLTIGLNAMLSIPVELAVFVFWLNIQVKLLVLYSLVTFMIVNSLSTAFVSLSIRR